MTTTPIPILRPWIRPTKGMSDKQDWEKTFFNGTSSYINAGNNSSLDITGSITVNVWTNLKEYGTKYGISCSAENVRTFVDKTGTNPNFTNAASYAVYDTTAVNANSKGFAGACFDGRYVYYVPFFSGAPQGQITRYDTTLAFNNAASYAVFDTTTVNANSAGFAGAVFDGRYIYLVPQLPTGVNGQITRYDTTLPFNQAASYAVYDTTAVNANSKGFDGAVFDGRYVYLVPFSTAAGVYSGLVARYDTTLPFTSATSYAVYDTTAVNANSKGFQGAVFDGRYVYFIPNIKAAGTYNGQVTRYDTTLPFTNAASYLSFDLTTVNANAKGFSGGVFDGRYVYYSPQLTAVGVYSGLVARYDTTLPFTSATSYAVYDTTAVNVNSKGFSGNIFDGRYVYYVPRLGAVISGQITRYDTTLPFNQAASYAVYDTTAVNVNSKGFIGSVFDGRYVYLVPFSTAAGVYSGQVTRYDTTSTNISYSMYHGLGQNSFGDTPKSPGLRINTSTGHYSVWTNRNEVSGIHFISAVYNQSATTLSIYVDAQLVNTVTASGNITTDTNNLTIGSILNSFLPGEIYEVSIISQALDQGQLQNLMEGRFIPTQFSCKLWHDYRLGHSYDISGNTNNGINTNINFKA